MPDGEEMAEEAAEEAADEAIDDLTGDLVPDEAAAIGGLVDIFAEEEFEGPPYYCLLGPDVDGMYTEEIVEAVVAQTCGDFCTC